MRQLILYGKPDCHLCHAAHDFLRTLQAEYGFALDEVDISQDSALEQRYGYAIPVIVIDSELELSAPLS